MIMREKNLTLTKSRFKKVLVVFFSTILIAYGIAFLIFEISIFGWGLLNLFN